jgi:phage terminase Nu1 subunit (DNA packaging protein)
MTKDNAVTAAELAWRYDCTTRQVGALAQAGIVVRIGRGRYDERASTRNYIAHLRKQAAGRVGPGADANAQYKAVRTRLLELRLKRESGELLDREDVCQNWAQIVLGIRAHVLGIPNAFHFEEPSLTTHAKGTLDRLCRDRLEDMAMQRGFSVLALTDLCGECGRPVADAPPIQENNDENEVGK